jgi:hypothetical protein
MYEDDRQDERKPTPKSSDRRMLALLGLELTGLVVAAVAVGLIAGSCGEKRDDAANAVSTQPSSEAVSTPVATVASHVPTQASRNQITSADSLPPEVTASVGDTLVIPGSAIEIDAQASVDATELSLWDGLGKRQPFSYDAQGKVWRAFYRVPLKSQERLGLSVSAKNEAGRWRRVWVFLHIGSESGAEADSTK